MLLYSDLADWFHLLTAPEEYVGEATHYRNGLVESCDGPAVTLLELGSGGGNNASHLKQWFTCTLTDLSPEMLAQSLTINPECEHVQGDMRTVRLGRTFDVVFVHDAVVYLTELDDIRAAAVTAFAHLRPGGAALFAPDYVRESFQPGTDHGGHDGDDGRALRYLEWVRDEDPDDSLYEVDLVYTLLEADGSVRVEHDHCIEGLFVEEEWLEALRAAGFEASTYPPFEPEEYPGQRIFIGKKPR
ncbi:MAG: class I SAM-dependent methyltransferase [Chloroflexi bacterium]|nr:class I SAM-dependent methyltransferase [Chloroflexota bacterium]